MLGHTVLTLVVDAVVGDARSEDTLLRTADGFIQQLKWGL